MVVEERNGLIEAYHMIDLAVVNSRGELLFSSGDPHHITFTRSCIKPIQALPLLFTGGADAFQLTDKEIATISGSHSGEPEHLETVRSILEKAGIEEEALKCKGHVPFNKDEARKIGQEFKPIHDNCSGKHAGALAACKHNGWDMDSYLGSEHPLTKEIVSAISNLTGLPEDEVHVGSDGCDIPNFAIPIDKMAQLFSLLMDPDRSGYHHELERLGGSMLAYPKMVAGTDRFDTVLMEDMKGIVLSKAGATGLQSIAVDVNGEWLGVAIKVKDGAYGQIIPKITYHILEELGVVSGNRNKYNTPLIKTRSSKKVGGIHSFGKMMQY